MRVGEQVPAIGTVFEWDIDEIMERESLDSNIFADWQEMMESKRADAHYADVKESISRWGFLRTLTAYAEDGVLKFGDGHHRLAAAQELGMTTVPVTVHERPVIAIDSGEWYLGDDIEGVGEDEVW